ncbi:hypothetical protein BJ742DRAFT_782466 [Cladochytrium replicatum]|nr:hypothetical protein BJ742DRAFT_782466 [Cladochytrium replicatum]
MSNRKVQVECFISKVTDPFVNLAFEEWLFKRPDSAPFVLYLWRNRPCVVIGRNQNPWKECDLSLMEKEEVWLVRRRSGGGTVYHDIGNSCFTVIMPRTVFDRRHNAELVTRALHQLDIPASVNHRNDIVVEGKKVSGSAYKLVNNRAYHHGTMLIDTDLDALRRYLKPPNRNLVGKGVESVRSEVTRLREHSYTVDHLSFCEAVSEEFCRSNDIPPVPMVELTMEFFRANEEIQQVYEELMTWEWIYGQTPEFHQWLNHKFSWGELDLLLLVRNGLIKEVGGTCSGENSTVMQKHLADFTENMKGRRYTPASLDFPVNTDSLSEVPVEVLEEMKLWIKQAI